MGVPVTVDSEDLEALLFATSVVKNIEAVLKQAKADPFVENVKPRITAAHDRIADAYRAAERRKEFPERFEPPDTDEILALQKLWPIPEQQENLAPRFEIFLRFNAVTDAVRDIRKLMVKGLVEFGVPRMAVDWGVTGERTVRTMGEQWVRITPRGQAAVEEFEKPREGTLQ